jgi:DNA-directed RNA polymerase subunit RPC12/RpoP
MQTVTADMQLHGWACAACGQPFRAGDLTYGVPVAIVSDMIIEGEYRCVTCWLNGEEVE